MRYYCEYANDQPNGIPIALHEIVKVTGKEFDELVAERKAAKALMLNAAAKGDEIAAGALALENIAMQRDETKFIVTTGMDFDDDDDDVDIRPF